MLTHGRNAVRSSCSTYVGDADGVLHSLRHLLEGGPLLLRDPHGFRLQHQHFALLSEAELHGSETMKVEMLTIVSLFETLYAVRYLIYNLMFNN